MMRVLLRRFSLHCGLFVLFPDHGLEQRIQKKGGAHQRRDRADREGGRMMRHAAAAAGAVAEAGCGTAFRLAPQPVNSTTAAVMAIHSFLVFLFKPIPLYVIITIIRDGWQRRSAVRRA
ncbi:hypothetical protein [Cohnella sp. 56]|uniref:hypothetical protein n=1 Tax=Cohnella sp. 56 TaxID=3113722 RepID=UPI0030EA3DC0